MATEPRRLRLLKALTSVLESITVDNGYATDLGEGHVFRGRAVFGENDPVPMVSILESPIPPDQLFMPDGGDADKISLDLIVQGFCLDDPENPTDPAHILLADVKQALVKEKMKELDGSSFGLYWVEGIRIGVGVVRPPDDVSDNAYFWLTVTISYIDNLIDPYED